MKKRILVVSALKNEIDFGKLSKHVTGIYSGVGKINAAISIVKAISDQRPNLIVNFGTAGKINPNLSGLIEISKTIQRDMLTEPLAPRGRTPFSSDPDEYSSGHAGYVCGTGDSFVTGSDQWLNDNGVDVVDMELYAIAKAAAHFDIQWRAFKYITDGADESAGHEWHRQVNMGEKLFLERFDALYAERA